MSSPHPSVPLSSSTSRASFGFFFFFLIDRSERKRRAERESRREVVVRMHTRQPTPRLPSILPISRGMHGCSTSHSAQSTLQDARQGWHGPLHSDQRKKCLTQTCSVTRAGTVGLAPTKNLDDPEGRQLLLARESLHARARGRCAAAPPSRLLHARSRLAPFADCTFSSSTAAPRRE